MSSTTTTTTTTTTVSTTTTTTVPIYGVISGNNNLKRDSQIGPESDYVASAKVLVRTEVDRVWGPQQPGATWEGNVVVEYTTEENGVMSHSFGDEQLFFRLWFEPTTIDAGFIVETAEYTIKIWNAWFAQVANVTNVATTGETQGIDIDHDATPFEIAKFGDTTSTITVYRSGPPLQNTTFTFTVDGEDYATVVTGIRVVAWAPEPDWDKRVRVEIIFETVLELNRYFVEQRRPLRDLPFRRVRVRATAKGIDNEKLKQALSYGHDKVFGVPIYGEHCYASAPFNGLSTIQLSNETDYLWHLNNMSNYIVIIDHLTLLAEIKEISVVNSTSIELVRNVTETFAYQRVVIYPMIIATLEGMKSMPETDDLESHAVSFLEYETS